MYGDSGGCGFALKRENKHLSTNLVYMRETYITGCVTKRHTIRTICMMLERGCVYKPHRLLTFITCALKSHSYTAPNSTTNSNYSYLNSISVLQWPNSLFVKCFLRTCLKCQCINIIFFPSLYSNRLSYVEMIVSTSRLLRQLVYGSLTLQKAPYSKDIT